MTAKPFRLTWFAICASWLVASAAHAGLPIYDLTLYKSKPESWKRSVVKVEMLTTSEIIFDKKKLIARAARANAAGNVFLIDIEHSGSDDPKWNPILRKYGRNITDRELLSVACQRADLIGEAVPTLKVGIWVMNRIDVAPYQGNISGDLDPLGVRSRRSLAISADWIGIGAYLNHRNIDQWLTWYPDLIHKRRLAWRTRLIIFLDTQRKDGSFVPLDHLERMWAAIGDDADGVGFFGKSRYREMAFDENWPWVQFAKNLKAGRYE